jgi:hypothetical protein
MAVSSGYLAKMRRALRRSTTSADEEITDLIEECRSDLILLGVLEEKVNDEADSVILGAVRCFVRWKFGVNNTEAVRMQDEYMTLRDELRRRREYCTAPTG